MKWGFSCLKVTKKLFVLHYFLLPQAREHSLVIYKGIFTFNLNV